MLDIKAALTGTLRRMHYVRRYSSIPTLLPENVAEHSWQVAMLGYLIGTDINQRETDEYYVDVGVVVQRAIMHDVSESMSGDIIRSFKHGSKDMRDACERQDMINVGKLAAELGLEEDFIETFATAKADDLEGRIVALADMLCVVSYCVSEHRLGNRQADFVLRELYCNSLVPWKKDPILGRYVKALFNDGQWFTVYKEM